MSKMGNEMILDLAARLQGFDKTAAKKDDDKDKECPKCECDPCECDKKEDKKDKKDDKKEDKKDDKKKADVMQVLDGLSKLASELDEIGADDASAAVDDALRVIVKNLQAEE